MVVHAFIPSTPEANTGQPGLHSDSASKKKKKKTDRQIHLHVLAIFIIKVVYFKTHGLSFITGTKRK